jgi:hypothetical protein
VVTRIIVLWALLAVSVQAVSVRDIIARMSLSAFVEDNALTVAADGSGDYLTIAAAVVAASAGDTIRIIKSPHTEGGILLAKDLIIEGLGAANTIVQANANRLTATTNIFTMTTSTNSVTFRDLTLRHGYSMADSGGAIRFSGYGVVMKGKCHERKGTDE